MQETVNQVYLLLVWFPNVYTVELGNQTNLLLHYINIDNYL